MKIVELLNNLSLPITNEEADLLSRFDDGAVIYRSKFNERQQHVANQLVNKDVLLRLNQDGQITYQKKIRH
jgi:hypothetical protein